MATIFRGPTYAQQQRKPPKQTTSWVGQNLLITTLALASAVPFKTADVFVTPQHPSHKKSANADTSKGTPKTLTADANQAFFVAPHFAPQHPGKKGRLTPNADTTNDTPLTMLVGTAPKPTFNPLTLRVDRPRPVADTSQDSPLTLLTVVFPKPFANPPTLAVALRRSVTDTSKGSFGLADTAFASAQIEFLPAPHLKRIGSETSQSSSQALLSPPPTPPLLNTLARTTFVNQQKTKGNLGSETSRGIAPPGAVAAPFANPPTLAAPAREYLAADTSESTAKVLYEDAARSFRTRPLLRAPELRRSLTDTSGGIPATLGTAVPPFVNLPLAGVDLRRSVVDTSEGTPKTLYSDAAVSFFNPPQIQVDRQRPVTDSSQKTPSALLAGVQSPFANPPSLQVDRLRTVADTCQGTSRALQSVTGAPFAQYDWSTAPEYRPQYGTKWDAQVSSSYYPAPGPKPFANEPGLQVAHEPALAVPADTSQGSRLDLLASVVVEPPPPPPPPVMGFSGPHRINVPRPHRPLTEDEEILLLLTAVVPLLE